MVCVRGGSQARQPRRVVGLVSVGLALALVVVTGCVTGTSVGDRIGVAVTIPPLQEFVQRVGGDLVDVTVIVSQGDPHESRLTSGQVKAVAEAEMYAKVGSGIEFELLQLDDLLETNKDIVLVDCSEGVELIPMDGEHNGESGSPDPHIWMSPPNAAIMVRNICDGLVRLDPENRDYYLANRDAYIQELEDLDGRIRQSLAGVSKRTFMVYHPSLGYFAAEYGLTMLSVEEGGKEPTGDLTRTIEQAKENDITVVFTSPLSDPRPAEVIASAIRGEVRYIDPLAADYISNMHAFLDTLLEALE